MGKRYEELPFYLRNGRDIYIHGTTSLQIIRNYAKIQKRKNMKRIQKEKKRIVITTYI